MTRFRMTPTALLIGLTASLLLAESEPSSARAQASDVGRQLSSGVGQSRTTFNFARGIAADASGRVHAVWHTAIEGGSAVYYRRSPDGGETWENARRLSAESGSNEHPSVAVSGDDVFVVWHCLGPSSTASVYLRQSVDGGREWGPVDFVSNSGKAAHASLVAVGDVVHLIWKEPHDGETEVYYRRSKDGGREFAEPRRLTDAPAVSYVPSVAASGEVVVLAWVDTRDGNEEEYVKASTDGGATWGPDTRITGNRMNSWAPSVAVDGRTIHLAWFDQKDAPFHLCDAEAKLDEALRLVGLKPESPPDGVHVPDPEAAAKMRATQKMQRKLDEALKLMNVSFTPTLPGKPPVRHYGDVLQSRVQAKQQQLMAAAPAWVRGGGSRAELGKLVEEFQRRMKIASMEWDIYYRRSDDAGETWGDEQRVVDVPGLSHRPHLAVRGKELHLVWWDNRDGNDEIYHNRSTDGGRTWGEGVRITSTPTASQFPMIATASSGLHLIWTEFLDGNADVYYKRIGD